MEIHNTTILWYIVSDGLYTKNETIYWDFMVVDKESDDRVCMNNY